MNLLHYTASFETRRQWNSLSERIAELDVVLKTVQDSKIRACFSRHFAPVIAFLSFGCFCSANLRARAALEAKRYSVQQQLIVESKRNIKRGICVLGSISAIVLCGQPLPSDPLATRIDTARQRLEAVDKGMVNVVHQLLRSMPDSKRACQHLPLLLNSVRWELLEHPASMQSKLLRVVRSCGIESVIEEALTRVNSLSKLSEPDLVASEKACGYLERLEQVVTVGKFYLADTARSQMVSGLAVCAPRDRI